MMGAPGQIKAHEKSKYLRGCGFFATTVDNAVVFSHHCATEGVPLVFQGHAI
jgi:hypothetical protein